MYFCNIHAYLQFYIYIYNITVIYYCIIWYSLVWHKILFWSLTMRNSLRKSLQFSFTSPDFSVSPPLKAHDSTHEQKFGRWSSDQTQYCFMKTHKKIFQHTWQLLQSQLHPNYSSAPGAGSLYEPGNLFRNITVIDRLQFFSGTLMFACYFFLSHVNDWQLSHPLWIDCVCASEIDFNNIPDPSLSQRLLQNQCQSGSVLLSYLNNRENKPTRLFIFKTWTSL